MTCILIDKHDLYIYGDDIPDEIKKNTIPLCPWVVDELACCRLCCCQMLSILCVLDLSISSCMFRHFRQIVLLWLCISFWVISLPADCAVEILCWFMILYFVMIPASCRLCCRGDECVASRVFLLVSGEADRWRPASYISYTKFVFEKNQNEKVFFVKYIPYDFS